MKKILFLLMTFIICLALGTFIFHHDKNEENIDAESIKETIHTIVDEEKKEVNEPEKKEEEIYVDEISKDYAPIEISYADFVSTWNIENSDGYTDYVDAKYDHVSIGIADSGSSNQSIKYFNSGFTIYGQTEYVLTFKARSDISRDISVSILNGNDFSTINNEVFSLNNDMQTYQLSFKTAGNVWNGRIQFNLGSSNDLGYHSIELEDIFIEAKQSNSLVRVNHIGYLNSNQKRFETVQSQGDLFYVYNTDTNEIVYKGFISGYSNDLYTREWNGTGDFTNVLEDGNYQIKTQLGGTSTIFSVGNNLYNTIYLNIFKFFSIQRCGYWLDGELFGGFAHDSCHTSTGTYYELEMSKDIFGGWHDAGDYGRYVETGSKAVNDLLFAYMSDPESFTDDFGIMESGNGIPDILDEARVELEWLIRMQTDWGEVYSKIVTKNFAPDISPEKDYQPLYILNGETTCTADTVASLAIASVLYKEYDAEFAAKCFDSAVLSWGFLMNNPQLKVDTNPEGFSAGLYRDSKDTDERFFAASAMYYATKDKQYLNYAKDLFNENKNCSQGVNYTNVGAYGKYLFIKTMDDSKFKKELIESLETDASNVLYVANENGYNASLTSYSWGSNGEMANNGILLMFAYDVTKNEDYRQCAVEQLNYLFGKNSLNMTFVTGHGENSPKNPHQRTAYAKGISITGALVGGPDSSREDKRTAALPENTAEAKMYVDSYTSYSTNEVAIYWNSALFHLMTRLHLD